MPLLVLFPAVIGLGCVALRGLPPEQRSGGLRFLAAAGASSSVLLFLLRGSEASWSTMSFAPQRTGLVALASLCAWLLVLVGGKDEEARWDIGALVGAGGTALAVIGSTRWIVPLLLFWVMLSAAGVAAARARRTKLHLALIVGLADACFVTGSIGHAVTTETWALPSSIEGPWPFLLAAAVILRAGALPLFGMGAAFGRAEAALLPLLVTSAFAVIPFISSGDEVGLALSLLLLAAGAIAWTLVSDEPRLSVIATWPVATMLAIAWIEPAAIARAGATAAIATALVALWPLASGRAQSERGLVLAALPATIGFGAIASGAASSFRHAVEEPSVLAAAPWDAFAALLPAVLAGGVAVGATIGRRTELEHFRPEAVLVTWALALVALVTGLTPAAELGFSGPDRAVSLFLLAVIVAILAARFAPRDSVPITPPRPAPPVGVVDLQGRVALWAQRGGLISSLAAAVAVLWLTYRGLATGFL